MATIGPDHPYFDEMLKHMEREVCIAMAVEALGIERVFLNFYRCDVCGTEWQDKWSCACDDRCEHCDTAISPYRFEIEGEE